MPRPPPVTKARFPERLITAPPRNAEVRTRNAEQQWEIACGGDAPLSVPRSAFRVPSSLLQLCLHDPANHMFDRQLQLLDLRGLIGRNDERVVDQAPHGAAALAE